MASYFGESQGGQTQCSSLHSRAHFLQQKTLPSHSYFLLSSIMQEQFRRSHFIAKILCLPVSSFPVVKRHDEAAGDNGDCYPFDKQRVGGEFQFFA